MHAARLSSAPAALSAILAGNATITLRSTASGDRFTFKIRRAKGAGDPCWFVSLLTGPNNESDFAYIGIIRNGWGNKGPRFQTTQKSKVTADAKPCKAITWAIGALWERGEIPGTLEIWHEGSCCRCGRTLTVPESLASGLGPECAKKGKKGGSQPARSPLSEGERDILWKVRFAAREREQEARAFLAVGP